ncbi:hypothetical protein BDN67DRAFT_900756, partial [Paxillus ammoniavirescens]
VTALQTWTFAVWTLTSAIVRGYAAYSIHNKPMYDMALGTLHPSYSSCKINVPVLSPNIRIQLN